MNVLESVQAKAAGIAAIPRMRVLQEMNIVLFPFILLLPSFLQLYGTFLRGERNVKCKIM